jgi:hypothetical protein
MKLGNPFPDNILLTDNNGEVHFPTLKDLSLPVSAGKAGYSNASVFLNHGDTLEISLQPQANDDGVAFMQGQVLDIPHNDKRTLELGLFLPSFRPGSLLNFNPQEVVSSYRVEIDVYGKRRVPGNLVLPAQDKTYFIFPVHIEKPEFMMPLPRGLSAYMTAIAGNVPMGTAIDMMKEKDFLGILNITTLTHLNWTNKMTVANNERFDISTNQALVQRAIHSDFQNVPVGLDAVSISLLDPANDRSDFIPLDIKSIKANEMSGGSGQIQLARLAQLHPTDSLYVFSSIFSHQQLIPDPDGVLHRINFSSVLKKVDSSPASVDVVNSAYLKMIEPISVSADHREYRFTSAANNNANLGVDLVILNVYSERPNATTQGHVRKLLWTGVLPGSSTSLRLPKLGDMPSVDRPEERLYWEVIGIHQAQSQEAAKGKIDVQGVLKNLEYVSSVITKL